MFSRIQSVHFVGICGTAMASTAVALQQKGIKVTGSDQNVYPPMSTFLAERKIELQQNLLLRLWAQVDQQIATRDQVHSREWRIRQHILRRKHHEPAHLGYNSISVVYFGKEAGQPRRRRCYPATPSRARPLSARASRQPSIAPLRSSWPAPSPRSPPAPIA